MDQMALALKDAVMEIGILKSLIILVLVISFSGVITRVLIRLLKVPLKIGRYFIANSLSGLLLLTMLNKFGFGVAITAVNVMIAGVFGVPGLIIIGML